MQIARKSFILASLTVLALSGAACGGSDEGSGSDGGSSSASEASSDSGTSISVVAQDNVFEPESIEIPAGEEVTIEFTNEGEAPHTFTVPGSDVDTGTVAAGESASVTLSGDDGTEFVCTIHAESDDMKGEIVSK